MTANSAVFEDIGREVARQLVDKSLADHVESAEDTLNDDDLVAFALVAIREGDDGLQGADHRCIDPEVVIESDRDAEVLIDDLHECLVDLFERRIDDR